jgi:5-methyltetrahydrofolate--homocysteine methyltransferase
LYSHVFYGPDASAAAVLAKKYMMDPEGFENDEHKRQEEVRNLYYKGEDTSRNENMEEKTLKGFAYETYPAGCPSDISAQQIPAEEILPYFDWKMFYAIWGVRYGSSSMEAMELVQLRRDAEDEISLGNFRIMLSAKFFPAYRENDDIVISDGDAKRRIPMMRQEKGDMRSLCDYIIDKESGRTSPMGCFAVSVHAADAHEEGCCCPACSNKYEDLIGKAVRMTLAEAASSWLDRKILQEMQDNASGKALKVIKPAAGYSSCPDHTLKRDILTLLGESPEPHTAVHSHHDHGEHCTCGCHQTAGGLKIKLTESCAMTPEASICGTIFIHPEAKYPEIRVISREQYDSYVQRRGMNEETARRFLGHLMK